MGSSQDFKSFQETIQNALVSTTRLANQIAAEDLSFQRTSNPDVADDLDDISSRLLNLASSLLNSAAKGTDLKAPRLEDADDVEARWPRVVDVLDHLLEKTDTCLDEYTGAIKRKTALADQPAPAAPAPPTKRNRYSLEQNIRRANMIKPQNAFEIKPDNHNIGPWKPILTRKPHAILPLDQSLRIFSDENQSTQYKHPYETEILALKHPDSLFQQKEPTPYLPFESTTATFVDTFEGVLAMLEELKGAKEIAIDTEHHDFRTYTGLLSLMQISTREKDWIVDTLQPWRHKLEILNKVFADPSIIKVLHGAYMDIIWLQRDCGLYIVGLFDTYEAACALQYPGRSLAYLLKRFVDFDADKKYQLADWRIRPLPEEMFYYARSDTHYLLYIYDNLRNEILSSSQPSGHDLMRLVLKKSDETAIRTHESSVYDAETGQGAFGWYSMLIRQSSGKLSKEQLSVFRAIHQWRDELARQEDESPLFVMNNATLFDITRRLPPDPKALHGLLDSGSFLAKREVTRLFQIITKAIAQGANGPTVAEVIRQNSQAPTMGIGEVARTVLPQLQGRTKDPLDTKDLVTNMSRLWGEVPMSSRWDSQGKAPPPKQVQFELPWAQFVQSAKVVDDTSQIPGQEATPNSVAIESPQPAASEATNDNLAAADDEFTLRTGMKRKAPESESGSEPEIESELEVDTNGQAELQAKAPAATSDEIISISDDHSESEKKSRKARKAERKAKRLVQREKKRQERKDRKAAEKQQQQAMKTSGASSNKDGAEESDDEPFDYTKAKSVLKGDNNTKNLANSPATGKGKGKGRFNPYALTAEGPKPARRMHGEKAGKSHTFKN
ncbi:ribonuclease H-like domain-containing protein [Nemania sp. FL0916]|nr:ribonuclease H-like domain-containing protein [Nemania sp. FL0916]